LFNEFICTYASSKEYPNGVSFRNQILHSERGVSLISTLVAVAIGAIVASLIASVISDAVKGQRMVIDRDEMSEFSLFVKNLLTTDSTCTGVLGGKPFAPGGKLDLTLGAVGYGGNPAAVISSGFQFAEKTLQVTSLTIEDKGQPPVAFNIPGPPGAGGVVAQIPVNRYMARVALNISHVSGSTGGGGTRTDTAYRTRYFEFPVLVDGGNLVQQCNNELNLGDACNSLGFQYTLTGGAMNCQPQGACLSGGSYVLGPAAFSRFGAPAATTANPVTGQATCPAGYNAYPSGAINIAQFCQKDCDFFTYQTVVQCLKCPP
jgi:hypothetical protein